MSVSWENQNLIKVPHFSGGRPKRWLLHLLPLLLLLLLLVLHQLLYMYLVSTVTPTGHAHVSTVRLSVRSLYTGLHLFFAILSNGRLSVYLTCCTCCKWPSDTTLFRGRHSTTIPLAHVCNLMSLFYTFRF